MAIKFMCPCGTALKVRDEYAGSPVKCSGCKATVQVPKADGTISANSPQIAQTVVAANSAEPWYYGFMVSMGFLGFICGILQNVICIFAYLAKGGSIAEGMPFAYVIASSATFLGSMLSYAVSLVLADIGRNIRRAGVASQAPKMEKLSGFS